MTVEYARLDIKVHPGAGKNEIAGFRQDVLNVRITARPEKGKANAALVEFLSDALGIAKSRIRIVRGTAARLKTVEIEGMDTASVLKKLGAPG